MSAAIVSITDVEFVDRMICEAVMATTGESLTSEKEKYHASK